MIIIVGIKMKYKSKNCALYACILEEVLALLECYILVMQKTLPFSFDQVKNWTSNYPTPFYIYDETGIRAICKKLNQTFSWAPHFKEYFAVKALPNPSILEVLKSEGLGADCSSMAELLLAERVGMRGEEIMFTSNNGRSTPQHLQKSYGMLLGIIQRCVG